jgi:hypothetical protein
MARTPTSGQGLKKTIIINALVNAPMITLGSAMPKAIGASTSRDATHL